MKKKGDIISNSFSKKYLVICAPYLNNIGGTEIEAVNTAVNLYDSLLYQKIILFSPKSANKTLFQNIIGDRKVNFLTYPTFFSSSFVDLINRIFFKFGCRYKISEGIYWKFMNNKISTFFILTYPKCSYFFPILKTAATANKIIGKITMGQFDILPHNHLNFYKRFDSIIVFNDEQKDFWLSNYQFNQVLAMDIMIPNEIKLLLVSPIKPADNNNLVFGFLGRISSEKNIMDMIRLLDFLNNKNKLQCKLIIQGEGDAEYINKIISKIKDLNLTEFVIFNNWFIDPMLTHQFFDKIEVFLVTSIHEGGPITALEASAAGRIVLGYDIGVMSDRFGKFPYLVNKNFEELCDSTLEVISMDFRKRNDLALKIKDYYCSRLSNQQKSKALIAVFDK